MQSLSGAGHPGVSAHDMVNNVLPWIKGEKDKPETDQEFNSLETYDLSRFPRRPMVITDQPPKNKFPYLFNHLPNRFIALLSTAVGVYL